MDVQELGYGGDLFVLPFDHRSSFEAGLLGIRSRRPNPEEVEVLCGYKRVVYDGFLQALGSGIPSESAAILVDQKYGSEILADANKRGVITCVPVEKSGQAEFDFEYGADYEQRLQEANPTFVKALVRYNPEDDPKVNENQQRRLKVLSDHTHSAGYKFMFELLVPATGPQLESVNQDKYAYDLRLRPEITVKAISDLQKVGIEPDIWKLEGMEDSLALSSTVRQAQAGGREGVGIIVLGRGEDDERVGRWLAVGAQTRGVIGFAVGRTTFWGPLVEYQGGKVSRAVAVSRIAGNYKRLYDLFIKARAASPKVEAVKDAG